MTCGQETVILEVDWTRVGRYRVLEASLAVDGQGIPLSRPAGHQEDLKGRRTMLELTMW